MLKRFLLLLLLSGTALTGQAQDPGISSASSNWVKVKISPETPHPNPLPTPVAFRETFTNNLHAWRQGIQGDYTYSIDNGSYTIHRSRHETKRFAYSYISLPENINLNKADSFTVQVDIAGKPGTIPEGGLLIGMLDSLNYCQIRLTDQGQLVIGMVIDGKVSSRYFPGGISSPQHSVKLESNTLAVRRIGNTMHVFINKQEVTTSPFPFRYFMGNHIGVMTGGDGISFRNLLVRLRAPALSKTTLVSN